MVQFNYHCPAFDYVESRKFSAYTAYAYPAGGKAGTTFTIEVGGQYLETANALIFNNDGISGEIISYKKVLSRRDATAKTKYRSIKRSFRNRKN